MSSLQHQDTRKTIKELKTRTEDCPSAENQQILILHNRSKELESPIPPIYLLPREILVEIWNHNCGYHGVFQGERWLPSPLVVSWVSRHWRNIAINTPTLWCDIGINHDLSNKLLEMQLERSGSCLLRVMVYFSNSCPDGHATRMVERLKIALAHINRFRTFHFTWLGHRLVDALWLLKDASAPRLKYLHITCHGPCQIPFLGGGAADLTHVYISSMTIRPNLPLLTGLTSLQLKVIFPTGRVTHSELKNVLDASPNLDSLTLYGACVQYSSDSSYEPIHVPSLRSLIIQPGSYGDALLISRFISVFFAPGLLSLELRQWRSAMLKMLITAVATASSKFPILSKLTLRNVAGMDSEGGCWRELFQCFQSVKYLRLGAEHTGDASGLLKILACREAYSSYNSVLCPRLHTLAWLRFQMADEDLIDEFISQRISMGYPIIKLQVIQEQFNNIGPRAQDRLREHVDVEMYVESP